LAPVARRLPLLLLAAMLAVGVAVEALRFDSVDWRPKLPITLLVVVALARRPPAAE
jgi:hypothetical protein